MSWTQALFWFAISGAVFTAAWVRSPKRNQGRGTMPPPSDKCRRNGVESVP